MSKLTSEEVRMPLDDDSEGLIALGLLGGEFASYAASNLLSLHGVWSECYFWQLRSCFARQDRITPRIYLRDWKAQSRKPQAKVSKFTPGEHFHTLGTKFDTLDEAIEHLHARGYRYAGMVEEFVYKPE